MEIISNLILLRPHFLWLIIVAALVVWSLHYYAFKNNNWSSIIDKSLLPHLLGVKQSSKNVLLPLLLFIYCSLIIVLLAGPAYKKVPSPTYTSSQAVFILFNLSASMYAQDIQPSRLNRAKFKIIDLLHKKQAGRVALIALGDDAYVVTPLTPDIKAVEQLLHNLEPVTLPKWETNTSNLTAGISKVEQLITNSKVSKIDASILLVTDSAPQNMQQAIKQLSNIDIPSRILTIGTQIGAPIPVPQQGFLHKNKHQILAKMPLKDLQDFARQSKSVLIQLSSDDKDINELIKLMQQQNYAYHKTQQNIDSLWHEEAPFLLLFLLPFLALLFRRGWLIACIIVFIPSTAKADSSNIWETYNQQGINAYDNKNYSGAIKKFKHSDTQYATYNLANSLVKIGELKKALTEYDKILATLNKKDNLYQDAEFNKQLVENIIKQQDKQQQDKQQQDKQQQDKQQQDKQQQDKQQQDKQQQDKQQQDKQQQDKQQQDKQQQDKQQQDKQQQDKQQQDKQQQDKQQQDKQQQDKQQQDKQQQDKQLSQEDEQALKQWIQQIPSDNSSLLQRKFYRQYKDKHGY